MNLFSFFCDDISREEVVRRVDDAVQNTRALRIATVNAEFLVHAKRCSAFARALCGADIRVRDGFGVGILYWLRFQRAPRRIAGADLLLDLLALANARCWTVCIMNRKDGLSTFAEICEIFSKKYPHIKIAGGDCGVRGIECGVQSAEYRAQSATCHLILCSFGAPEQEIFLHDLQQRHIPAVMMGVGGALDFLTEKCRRAPRMFRRCGLEWLFRLWVQPGRFRRIVRAVGVFPFLAIGDAMRFCIFPKK